MGKFTLQQVRGASYFLSGRLSIGAYIKNGFAVLFDSGIDDGTAKSIQQALDEEKITVSAIINTHSHADHCGGNNYFQRKNPNIQIYASKYEKAFIEDTRLEPICFCAGAHPFRELRNKHLEATPSAVTNVIDPYVDQKIIIQEESFKIITLPGHTPGMIGVITPDNVFYPGDAIFGDNTFNKHGILFYTGIQDTLSSFKKIEILKVENTVFYHGGLLEGTSSLADIAKKHESRIVETKDKILSFIKESKEVSLDTLTQKVMKTYSIPEDITQYTLTQTCVRSYITQLQLEKRIDLKMNDGLLVVVPKEEGMTLQPDNKGKNKVEGNNTKTKDSLLESVKGKIDTLTSFSINENEKIFRVYFNPQNQLTGDYHGDLNQLNALGCLATYLKHKLIINQESSKVISLDPNGLYNGAELKYTPDIIGVTTNNNQKQIELPRSSVNITSQYAEFTLSGNVPNDWKNKVSTQLSSLNLQPQGGANVPKHADLSKAHFY